MKFDFSTILIVIIAVIPGLFAQRARNQLVPRSFEPQGASAELAEFVVLGVATHGILAFVTAAVLLVLGCLRKGSADFYFAELDSLVVGVSHSRHITEICLIASAYLFLCFGLSHFLGLFYGAWRSRSPITGWIFAHETLLKKIGVSGRLGERPILYEILDSGSDDEEKSVFVEIEMKNQLGFYSGQLSQFAIVKDEDPHKPIYLIDVWYKKERNDEYVSVEADGIMLDLADAATVLVRRDTPSIGKPPVTHQEIAARAYQLWIDEGFKPGTSEENWKCAEEQLSRE